MNRTLRAVVDNVIRELSSIPAFRRLVDEVANTLKVGQDATIELTQAQFRLVQNGLNYRSGNRA